MSILTTPNFFYIDPVTTSNVNIDFKEPNVSASQINAQLTAGSYTPSELILELQRVLNAFGTQTYTVTLNRSTRLVSISSSDTFELLVSTGSASGTSIYSTIGFTGSDRTGASSYIGDSAIGNIYEPQFPLQNFQGFETRKEGIQTTVNESSSGEIEVISFGIRRIMSFTITNITDRYKTPSNPIKNNSSGVQDALDFMDFITDKNKLEFIKDKTNPSVFDKMILSSTQESEVGSGYTLKELYSRGLLRFYETGSLKFRKLS